MLSVMGEKCFCCAFGYCLFMWRYERLECCICAERDRPCPTCCVQGPNRVAHTDHCEHESKECSGIRDALAQEENESSELGILCIGIEDHGRTYRVMTMLFCRAGDDLIISGEGKKELLRIEVGDLLKLIEGQK